MLFIIQLCRNMVFSLRLISVSLCTVINVGLLYSLIFSQGAVATLIFIRISLITL